jgi:hypothetical protein
MHAHPPPRAFMQLAPGDLVEISSSTSKAGATAHIGPPPHLARVLAIPVGNAGMAVFTPTPPQHFTAYLAPGLAHNLGLALHLIPLLHPGAAHPAHNAASAQRIPCVEIKRHGNMACDHHHRQQQQLQQQQQAPAEGVIKQQAYACIPVSGNRSALVDVALRVHLSVIRRPTTDVLRPPSMEEVDGSHGGAHGEGEGEGSEDGRGGGGGGGGGGAGERKRRAASTVAALQSYFLGATRVVSGGDVLAVARPPDSSAAALLPQLFQRPLQPGGAEQAQQPHPELLYFRVDSLEPEGKGPQAVDVKKTEVKLAGSSCGGVPVGVEAYLASSWLQPHTGEGMGVCVGVHGGVGCAHLLLGASEPSQCLTAMEPPNPKGSMELSLNFRHPCLQLIPVLPQQPSWADPLPAPLPASAPPLPPPAVAPPPHGVRSPSCWRPSCIPPPPPSPARSARFAWRSSSWVPPAAGAARRRAPPHQPPAATWSTSAPTSCGTGVTRRGACWKGCRGRSVQLRGTAQPSCFSVTSPR